MTTPRHRSQRHAEVRQIGVEGVPGANAPRRSERTPTPAERTLSELVLNLRTENGRIKAIVEAVQKGITKDPGHLAVAIREYLKAKDLGSLERLAKNLGTGRTYDASDPLNCHKYAADLYFRIEKYEVAAPLFAMTGNYLDAVYAAQKGLNAQQVKDLSERGISEYKRAGNYLDAGLLYQQLNDTEGAISMYVKGRGYVKAIELAYESGNTEMVRGILNTVHNAYSEALRQNSDTVRALANDLFDAYMTIHEYVPAIRLASKAGIRYDKVARIAEDEIKTLRDTSGSSFVVPENVVSKINEIQDALIGYYEEIGLFTAAADRARIRGDHKRADALIEKAISENEGNESFATAARIAEEAGKYERAIQDYIRAQKYPPAVRLLQASGNAEAVRELCEKAIPELESAQKFGVLAELYAMLGETERAQRLRDLINLLRPNRLSLEN